MMNFIERVTGSDITKVMKNLSVRIQNLSPAYQDAWEEILGSDIRSFCSSLFSGEEMKTYRDKWRRQLNQNVERRLGRLK